MASGGHNLASKGHLLESRIKTLINADLKTICKAYGEQVSGVKSHLQQRCIGIMQEMIRDGDVKGFTDLSARVGNHGLLPIQEKPTATFAPVQTPMARPTPPGMAHLSFKMSPFYEKVQTVVRPFDLPEMPQNRHTVKINLALTDDQARRLVDGPSTYRLMLYCAVNTGPGISLDVAFPPQIEVKVNDDDVKANFKGLKNRPGSTKPADITKMVRLRAGYSNRISVCYALTAKRFSCTVLLVRYVQGEQLVDKIRSARVFSKHRVLEEFNRQNADPDIAATSSKMSLKDPVSTLRIQTPIRSTFCTHNQCFDAAFFMQLQEQAPTWTCPICSKVVTFESLGVDKYFEEILQTTPSTIEQVTIEPNGNWQVVKEDEEKGMSNAAKGGARASYDDDFDDDDIVEVQPTSAVIKKETPSFNAFNTPPLSSREPSIAHPPTANGTKRQAVIDLTLSDDEDEPPRPAKRVTTAANAPRSTPIINPPIPLSKDTLVQPRTLPQERTSAFMPPLSNAQSDMSNVRASPMVSPYLQHRDTSLSYRRPSETGSMPPVAPMSASPWSTMRSPSIPPGLPTNHNRPGSVSQSPPGWATHSQSIYSGQSTLGPFTAPDGGVRLAPLQDQHFAPRPPSHPPGLNPPFSLPAPNAQQTRPNSVHSASTSAYGPG